MRLEAWGVVGLPEVRPGDDLSAMIVDRTSFADGDVLVVAQKVISKAEGRLRDLRTVRPSRRALDYAERMQDDPRVVQLHVKALLLLKEARVLGGTRSGAGRT